MAKRERPGNGTKREKMHPAVDSAEDIAKAHAVCEEVLKRVSDDDAEEGLLATCRMMTLGQLAHALLNLHTAFAPRDRALATVFKEKYAARRLN
jgi:hypothetical protein